MKYQDIIKGLELCARFKDTSEEIKCEECPYKDYAYLEEKYDGNHDCDEILMHDAYGLLKMKEK